MAGEGGNNAESNGVSPNITLTQEELANLIAQAVATYANTCSTVAPQNQERVQIRPCTFKTCMDCKPQTLEGTLLLKGATDEIPDNKRKRDNKNHHSKSQSQPPPQQRKFKTTNSLGSV